MTQTKTRAKRQARAMAPAEVKLAVGSHKPSAIDGLIGLLRRPDGVSLDECVAATNWQRHSVRGALAGAVRKKLGGAVRVETVDGVRRYHAPGDPA